MELVALLPLLAVVVGLAWQAVLAGEAVWLAGGAARAAARATALGRDPQAAARAALPGGLAEDVHATAAPGGAVTVAVGVPVVPLLGRLRLTTVHARAALPRQTG